MDTLKQVLLNKPGTGLASSLTGCFISLIDMLPDFQSHTGIS